MPGEHAPNKSFIAKLIVLPLSRSIDAITFALVFVAFRLVFPIPLDTSVAANPGETATSTFLAASLLDVRTLTVLAGYSSPMDIFSDDFESGTLNKWILGSHPYSIVNFGCHSGTYCAQAKLKVGECNSFLLWAKLTQPLPVDYWTSHWVKQSPAWQF